MTGRGGRSLAAMDDATLEAALRDFGSALEVPPAPDVSAIVAARVTAERHRGLRPGRVRVSLRWALLAAVLAVLALVALAAAGGFGLPGLRIGFVGPSASPSPSTGPSASAPSPSIRGPSPTAAAPSASDGEWRDPDADGLRRASSRDPVADRRHADDARRRTTRRDVPGGPARSRGCRRMQSRRSTSIGTSSEARSSCCIRPPLTPAGPRAAFRSALMAHRSRTS